MSEFVRPYRYRDVEPEVWELARVVSPATMVEPALLREARLTLTRGLDASVEGRLWRSLLVESAGVGGITLKADALRALREDLAGRTRKLNESVALIAAFHETMSREVQIEERVVAAAMRNDDEAGKTVERELRRLAEFADDVEIQRWAAYALPRMPESVGRSPSARRLGVAALRSPVPGRKISWMPRVMDEADDLTDAYRKLERTDLRVRRVGEMIHLGGRVRGPGTVRIPVPKTDPVEVGLEWMGLRGPQRETVHVPAGEAVRRQVGHGALRLKTLAGEVFELPPLDTKFERRVRDERYQHDLMVVGAEADRTVVRELVDVLRERGFAVWSYHDGLEGHEHWVAALKGAVASSRALLVAVSEKSAHAGMLRVGLDYYRSAGGETVLPLVLEKTEWPEWLREWDAIEWHGSAERAVEEIERRLAGRSEHIEAAAELLRGSSGPVWSVDFDPGGYALVAGCEDGFVRRWKLGHPVAEVVGEVAPGGRTLVLMLSDEWVVSGDGAGEVCIRNLHSGEVEKRCRRDGAVTFLKRLERPYLETPGPAVWFGTGLGLTSEMFAAVAEEHWSWSEHRERGATFGEVPLPGDTMILAAESGCWWNVFEEGRESARMCSEAAVSICALGLGAYEGRPERVAVGTMAGMIYVIDTASPDLPKRVLFGHGGPVWGVASHPSYPQLLASGSWDGTVRIWNVESGACLQVLPMAAPVNDVKFSPQGRPLAVACDDTRVHLCEIGAEDLLGRESRRPPAEWVRVARVQVWMAGHESRGDLLHEKQQVVELPRHGEDRMRRFLWARKDAIRNDKDAQVFRDRMEVADVVMVGLELDSERPLLAVMREAARRLRLEEPAVVLPPVWLVLIEGADSEPEMVELVIEEMGPELPDLGFAEVIRSGGPTFPDLETIADALPVRWERVELHNRAPVESGELVGERHEHSDERDNTDTQRVETVGSSEAQAAAHEDDEEDGEQPGDEGPHFMA